MTCLLACGILRMKRILLRKAATPGKNSKLFTSTPHQRLPDLALCVLVADDPTLSATTLVSAFPCRDVLAGEDLKGFTFDGNGYVIIDKARFNPRRSTRFTVKFRSMAEDGLLVFMGDATERDFLSVQLRGGKVVLMVRMCFI